MMMAKQKNTNCKGSYIIKPSPPTSAALMRAAGGHTPNVQQHPTTAATTTTTTTTSSGATTTSMKSPQHQSFIPRPRTTITKHHHNDNNYCHNYTNDYFRIYANTPASTTQARSSCDTLADPHQSTSVDESGLMTPSSQGGRYTHSVTTNPTRQSDQVADERSRVVSFINDRCQSHDGNRENCQKPIPDENDYSSSDFAHSQVVNQPTDIQIPKSKRRLTYNITDTLAKIDKKLSINIPEIETHTSDNNTDMIGVPHAYMPSRRTTNATISQNAAATYSRTNYGAAINHNQQQHYYQHGSYNHEQFLSERDIYSHHRTSQDRVTNTIQECSPDDPSITNSSKAMRNLINHNHANSNSNKTPSIESNIESSVSLAKGPSFLFGSPHELKNQQDHRYFTRSHADRDSQTKIAYVSPASDNHVSYENHDHKGTNNYFEDSKTELKSRDTYLDVLDRSANFNRTFDIQTTNDDSRLSSEPLNDSKNRMVQAAQQHDNKDVLGRLLNIDCKAESNHHHHHENTKENNNYSNVKLSAHERPVEDDLSKPPVFESYIMTGESIVRLSSNESDKPILSKAKAAAHTAALASRDNLLSACYRPNQTIDNQHNVVTDSLCAAVSKSAAVVEAKQQQQQMFDVESSTSTSSSSPSSSSSSLLLHAKQRGDNHHPSYRNRSNNNVPHATDLRHNEIETHSGSASIPLNEHENGNSSSIDQTSNQRTLFHHSAISQDDILVSPIPGTIRLQQSHFSSTPSMPREMASNEIHTQASYTGFNDNPQQKQQKISSTNNNNAPLTSVVGKRQQPQDVLSMNNEKGSSSFNRSIDRSSSKKQQELTNSNGQQQQQQQQQQQKLVSVQSENNILCHDDIPVGGNIAQFKRALSESHDAKMKGGDCLSSPKVTSAYEDKDRESARRLAKRLYNLSGFSKSDVCHHLSRHEPFSQIVVEEYLQLFGFAGMNVDAALRKFLTKLHLKGETQERERILCKFSQRYYECNKSEFVNPDAVQTLVCALVLLNMDLHGNNGKRHKKLSVDDFVAGLNDSARASGLVSTTRDDGGGNSTEGSEQEHPYTFPRQMLINLYKSIKKNPLKFVDDTKHSSNNNNKNDTPNSGRRANTLPTRRYASMGSASTSTLTACARKQFTGGSTLDDLDDTNDSSIEFKSGFLVRKRVLEANGRPTPKGRRGWKRMFVALRDLVLFMGADENNGKSPPNSPAKLKTSWTDSMRNLVKIHHAYAAVATEYTKRDHVFMLRTADQSELLFQASDESEMNSWIEAINFAAACLSAPVLPSAVSSNARRCQPLYPSSCTRLSFWEQLIDHDERIQRLKAELEIHLSQAPAITKKATKKSRADFIAKLASLRIEIQKYEKYSACMRKRSNSPEAALLSKHSKSLSTPFMPTDQ